MEIKIEPKPIAVAKFDFVKFKKGFNKNINIKEVILDNIKIDSVMVRMKKKKL